MLASSHLAVPGARTAIWVYLSLDPVYGDWSCLQEEDRGPGTPEWVLVIGMQLRQEGRLYSCLEACVLGTGMSAFKCRVHVPESEHVLTYWHRPLSVCKNVS